MDNFSLSDLAKVLSAFAKAAQQCAAGLAKAVEQMRAPPRQDWWKSGEIGEPEYRCDTNKPEWWQRGDDEPPFGQAV